MAVKVIGTLLFQLLFIANLNAVILKEHTIGNVVTTIKESVKNDVPYIVAETTDKHSNEIISYAVYTPSQNQTGWGEIAGWTNEDYDNNQTAYYVAFDEASLVTTVTIQYWQNTVVKFCEEEKELCTKIRSFIKENTEWVQSMINEHAKKDKYWWQINLVYQSLKGLYDGYLDFKEATDPVIPEEDFYFMNIRGEMYDLINKFSKEGAPLKYTYDGLGSAIIKLLPGNSDLLVGQNVWYGYNTMSRLGKRYQYNFKVLPNVPKLIPGNIVSFSSYPSVGHSIDQFYVTSAKLAVQKTAIKNFNDKLWTKVKPKGVIFEFARVQVANRLANNGKNWNAVFSKYSSGTGNGQWLVVDYKKFTPKHEPKEGLLWVVEQIPGLIKAEDVTSKLNKESYWASYNIPYNTDIYKLTYHHLMAQKYGGWFTYDKSPRALISKRDHKNIKCPCTMMGFLRSNNFKHDSLSKCACHPPYSAANAIAARLDLNLEKGSYPFPFLARHPGGAIDAKFVNASLVEKQYFIGASGPTTGTKLPVFQWSKSGFKDVPHLGQPDKWNFEPVILGY